MQDKMTIEFLPDGRVKIDTGSFSPATHVAADQIVKGINSKLGGETQTSKNAYRHQHGDHLKEHLHHHESE